MKHARFTREARAEFLAQTAYYETLRKGPGSRFRAQIEQAARFAATFPLHGKPGPAGTRARLAADFPFKLVHTEVAFGVLIHAVSGTNQLPEYWLGRIPRNDG